MSARDEEPTGHKVAGQEPDELEQIEFDQYPFVDAEGNPTAAADLLGLTSTIRRAQINNRLDAHGDRIDALDARLDRIEAGIRALRRKVGRTHG